MTDQLLTITHVADLLKVGRTSVWKIANTDRTFPSPVSSPIRGKRWRASDIEQWLKTLPHVGDAPATHIPHQDGRGLRA